METGAPRGRAHVTALYSSTESCFFWLKVCQLITFSISNSDNNIVVYSERAEIEGNEHVYLVAYIGKIALKLRV